jgi:hypothetical protein
VLRACRGMLSIHSVKSSHSFNTVDRFTGIERWACGMPTSRVRQDVDNNAIVVTFRLWV